MGKMGESMPVFLPALLLPVLFIAGCNRNRSAEYRTAGEREPAAVRVEAVRSVDNVYSDTYIGTVRASRSAVISCRHAGTLASLDVVQGQHVDKGDTIGTVSSQSVTSMRDMALATLAQAKDGYDRAKPVYEAGSMAEVKWVEIQTQLSKAEASAKAARKALDDCTMKAPYAGVVGDVFVDEGVELGVAEPVVRLMDISSVEISFPVPESEIGGVRTGMKVSFSVPALGDAVHRATVSVKGVSASALSHSYTCTAIPDGKIDGLMPGMVCKVSAGAAGSGIVIPASSVKTGMDGRYVWIVRDGKAEKRGIETGGFSGDGVIVESGLDSGDLLIVDGAKKVSSGMAVKVLE